MTIRAYNLEWAELVAKKMFGKNASLRPDNTRFNRHAFRDMVEMNQLHGNDLEPFAVVCLRDAVWLVDVLANDPSFAIDKQ